MRLSSFAQMPSYNLVRNMNLGDVTDTAECRNNLDLGSFSIQDYSDVNFQTNNIKIEELRLYPDGSTTYGNILIIDIDTNELAWSSFFSEGWYFQSNVDIPLSRFDNDLNFVEENKLKFTGSIFQLSNLPDLSSYFTDTYVSPLDRLSNLDINIIHDNLQLKLLSTFDSINVPLNDITVEGELHISDNFENPTTLAYTYINGTQEWTNLFERNILENDWTAMINTPITQNKGISIDALSNMSVHLQSNINIKNSSLVDVYENVIESIKSGIYIDSNLTNIDLQTFGRNLGFDLDIITYDSSNVIFKDLTILSDFTISNIPGMEQEGLLYYDDTTEHHLSLVDFEDATTTQLGQVFVSSVVQSESNEMNSLMAYSSEVVRQELEIIKTRQMEMKSNIDNLTFLDEDTLTTIRNLEFVDPSLSNLNENQIQKFIEILDLNTEIISESSSVLNLLNTPSSIYHLDTNNVMINHVKVQDPTLAIDNLGCGDMAIQDVGNVNIVNGTATLSKLEIDETFYLPINKQQFSEDQFTEETILCTINSSSSNISFVSSEDVRFRADDKKSGLIRILQNKSAMLNLLREDDLYGEKLDYAVSKKLANIVITELHTLLDDIESIMFTGRKI
jgi:hypothetical protein